MTENTPKPRKSRAGKSLKKINLPQVRKKLLNVLSRDTEHLLLASKQDKLNRDASNSLCNYLKLLRELEELQSDETANLTDSELEAIANGINPKTSTEDSGKKTP